MGLIFGLILFGISVSESQGLRQYITFPANTFPVEAKKIALNWFELRWQETLKDTTFLCYIRQSVWFNFDSIDVEIHVDSILGRGDQRRAKVTRYIYYDSVRVDSMTGSRWLNYTRKVSSPDWGWYIPATDSSNAANRWSTEWSTFVTMLWMEKVLGDPTVNNGWNQRPLFHFVYREKVPTWWKAYADSIRSLP